MDYHDLSVGGGRYHAHQLVLKRRFALKTIFLAAVILAIVGSLIMIVAQAFPLLIVARIIQGIGSGVATPLMINIILEQSPRSKSAD